MIISLGVIVVVMNHSFYTTINELCKGHHFSEWDIFRTFPQFFAENLQDPRSQTVPSAQKSPSESEAAALHLKVEQL
jgi:hypothetical protein